MADLATGPRTRRMDVRRDPRAVEQPEREAAAARPGPLAILASALWFGLAVGPLEVGLLFLLKPLRDPVPGLFRMNRHHLWMIPLHHLLLFGACGLLLAAIARFRPRPAPRFALFALAFLGFFSLLLACRPLFAWASFFLSCGLGYRLGRRLERNWAVFQILVARTFPALVLVAVVLPGGAYFQHVVLAKTGPWASGPAPAPSNLPNVLLIVLDTVRADRLSVYGYGRDTTPSLQVLAHQGIRFDRARSTAPWTLPSHASILTGRWPHQLSSDLDGPLDGTYPTLAEFLGDRGYDTAGFVANLTYTGAESGLSRGFAHYEDHDISPSGLLLASSLGSRVLWETASVLSAWAGRPLDDPRKSAAQVRGQLLDWLDHRSDRRPFFAFLNFYDVHNPYLPPRDYRRHFGQRPELPADREIFDRWFVLNKKTLPPRQVELIRDSYDDCIAYLDGELGRLFEELKRRGLFDKTLVVVTADHGEHFGEHGLYGHASSLYDQELHVPLLIAGPGGIPRGGRVGEAVSLRDIPATIAERLGFGAESPFPGRTLARHWEGARDDRGAGSIDPLLSEVDEPVMTPPNQGRSPVFRGSMKSLAADDMVYIRNGDGVEELYNLASDPEQARDLADSREHRPILDRFRQDLDRLLEREPPRVRRN